MNINNNFNLKKFRQHSKIKIKSKTSKYIIEDQKPERALTFLSIFKRLQVHFCHQSIHSSSDLLFESGSYLSISVSLNFNMLRFIRVRWICFWVLFILSVSVDFEVYLGPDWSELLFGGSDLES